MSFIACRGRVMERSKLRQIALTTLCASVCSVSSAALNSAADGFTDYARIVEVGCNFEYRPGREFQFPTADSVLQPYGFVLWRAEPSLAANPLDYSLHQGRRGKLSGETVIRDGVVWYSGLLDDCTHVYAEDASANASRDGLEHLSFSGKVFFADTYAAAKSLIGHDVIVRGEGLEPRQRLYTHSRRLFYRLSDRQVLRVLGIDTHRYAHAKGVGPFFLQVENAHGKRGLIKYNPDYLELPHGPLPIYQSPPGREFASTNLPAGLSGERVQGNQPMPYEGYALNLNRFTKQSTGLQAVAELQEAGFNAQLLEQDMSWNLRVEGFATERMAQAMLRILASRFGWLQLESLQAPTTLAQSGRARR